MPWQIGIDEAGYGPNLGPLTMAVVACRVPGADGDLWEQMHALTRRDGEEDDGRLLIADSKLVFTQTKGLRDLESGVLAFLCGGGGLVRKSDLCLLDLLQAVCANSLAEMHNEPWFIGDTLLPVQNRRGTIRKHSAAWRQISKKTRLEWGLAAVLVAAERFNGLIDRWGSKGAILGLGLTELLQRCLALPGYEPLHIVVDKHGGRNQYSVVLAHAFPDGMVLTREEGALQSVYEIVGLARPIHITFMPRADSAKFCVALASMICKYLRELLMGEFNRFWLEKVPGLEPTAGYPGDSTRFFEAIAPALVNLGITKESVWRER